jgi:hypothetical protein
MRVFALLTCALVLAAAAHLRAWGQVPPSALLVLHDAGRQIALLDARDGAVLAARPLPVRLSGPPQVSPDPPRLYWGTPEGHIVQLTLPDLDIAAQVPARVGSGTPRLALSGDGRWLLAAGAQDAQVQIFDATLQPARRIAITSPDGREQSRAAQVLTLAGSRSWLLALDTLRELWEISYDPAAAPIFDGLVHDYRMGEALPRSGFLGVRRTPLPAPLPDVLVPDGTRLVVGSQRCQPPAPCTLRLLHLDTRSQVAAFALPGTPHPSASAAWKQDGHPWLALAGLGTASAPLELPRAQPAPTAELPAHTRRVLYVENPATLWLQPTDSRWLRLDAHSLQTLAELDAAPNTRLLIVQGQPVLVMPGSQGSISLRDPLTLRERLHIPFTDLQGAWALHP